MKKLHSLIILLILTSAVFVGCSPSTGNGAEAVETESKVNEYGFISSETYTVVFTNGSSTTMTGEALTNAAKDTGMVNGTDYTIDGTTVSLTASGMAKMTSYLGNGGSSSGGNNTLTYTVNVPSKNYTTGSNSYGLAIKNPPINGYKKGDPVEILITNGSYNVSTGIWGTPAGLYLVKVSIKDSNGNDIKSTVGLKIEDNKIKFTMPSSNVNVYASFEDVVCRPFDFNSDTTRYPNGFDVYYSGEGSFIVALRFDTKEYDNLEPFGEEKFIYEFHDLESAHFGSNQWNFYIQLGNVCNDYDCTTKKGTYHENPVVIYNGTTMYEPKIEGVGYRYVNLDKELKNQK